MFNLRFLVNMSAPLVLPVVGILALKLLPIGPQLLGLHIMRTVKDGQLCWAIIAMGTPPPCELWEAWSGTKRPPPGPALPSSV